MYSFAHDVLVLFRVSNGLAILTSWFVEWMFTSTLIVTVMISSKYSSRIWKASCGSSRLIIKASKASVFLILTPLSH